MSIVVIGDRKTGKTSMVRALTEHGKYVKISNILASDLYNPSTKEIAGTAQFDTLKKELHTYKEVKPFYVST